MNNLKTTPLGVDIPIKRIQTKLYDSLETTWSSNIDGYGRVYKNKRKDKIVPEFYVGNDEYKEVLLDDSKDATFFFSVADEFDVTGSLVEVDCDIMFSVNLTAIKGNTNREDEEVRSDVHKLLDRYFKQHELRSIVTGVDNVYREFTNIAEQFNDMQEFHHFKIRLKLRYNHNNCI